MQIIFLPLKRGGGGGLHILNCDRARKRPRKVGVNVAKRQRIKQGDAQERCG